MDRYYPPHYPSRQGLVLTRSRALDGPQVLKCSSAKVLKCSSAQVHKCKGTQVLKCSCAQVHKCKGAQVLWCTWLMALFNITEKPHWERLWHSQIVRI